MASYPWENTMALLLLFHFAIAAVARSCHTSTTTTTTLPNRPQVNKRDQAVNPRSDLNSVLQFGHTFSHVKPSTA